jgi:hypothetical protein
LERRISIFLVQRKNHEPLNSKTKNIMGDKSPKSKQKNKNQKQGKSNTIAANKQRVIDGKKVNATLTKKK